MSEPTRLPRDLTDVPESTLRNIYADVAASPSDLSPEKERFVSARLLTPTDSEAARISGHGGMHDAAIAGRRLANDPQVARELRRRRAIIRRMVEREARRVVKDLLAIAASSIEHYTIDDDGHLRLAPGAPPDAYRAVSSIDRTVRKLKGGAVEVRTKVRFWPKLDAIHRVLQMLNLYKGHQEAGADHAETNNVLVMPDNGRQCGLKELPPA
jgi:hypothetical protein